MHREVGPLAEKRNGVTEKRNARSTDDGLEPAARAQTRPAPSASSRERALASRIAQARNVVEHQRKSTTRLVEQVLAGTNRGHRRSLLVGQRQLKASGVRTFWVQSTPVPDLSTFETTRLVRRRSGGIGAPSARAAPREPGALPTGTQPMPGGMCSPRRTRPRSVIGPRGLSTGCPPGH